MTSPKADRANRNHIDGWLNPRLLTYESDFAGTPQIACPTCAPHGDGLSYLHLVHVEVYQHSWETPCATATADNYQGDIQTGELVFPCQPSYELGSHRMGAILQFHCELCGDTPELRLGNRKGHMGMWWASDCFPSVPRF